MHSTQVKFIEHVPNYSELSSRGIWKELSQDPVINIYFPTYSLSRSPNKQYLLNVINTLRPNSIQKIVETLREKKRKKKNEDETIVITSEF